MSDLEDLIRQAGREGVTYMMSNPGGKGTYCGAWGKHPRSHYATVTHADPVEAIRTAILQALNPPPRVSRTSLVDLLGD